MRPEHVLETMANPTPLNATRWSLRDVFSVGPGERGVSAVEFALIIPFILMLTMGIIELSNVYYMRSQLSEIARDSVRRLAIGAQEEKAVVLHALERLEQTTGAKGKIEIAESGGGDDDDDDDDDGKRSRGGEIEDVTMTLSVPFSDVLLFDGLVEHLWADFPTTLSVNATMIKQ